MTELDTELARDWPERWEKANSGKGQSKKRNNLRKLYRGHVAYRAFVAANPEARCSNCQHMGVVPLRKDTNHCELDHDFYGYQIVKLDQVCTRWQMKEGRS